MFIDITKFLRVNIKLDRSTIKKSIVSEALWQALLDFEDVVQIDGDEYEIILSECETYFEIIETEDLSDDYESDDESIGEYDSDKDSDYND